MTLLHSAVPDATVRCSAVTANGLSCRITSMMGISSAEPLRKGGQFCTWHLSQCPSAAGSMPTTADEDRSSSPISLSQEQRSRIELNRMRAAELRRLRYLREEVPPESRLTSRAVEPPDSMLRMSSTETLQRRAQHLSQGPTSAVASADKGGSEKPRSSSPVSLSHEQRIRIELNRKRALEFRRRKFLRDNRSAQPQVSLDSVPATPTPRSRSPTWPPRYLSNSMSDPPLPQTHLRRLSTPSAPNATAEAKLALPVSQDEDDETVGADPDELVFAEPAHQQLCEEQDWFDVDILW
eukprot:TRINITY_DN33574_c0_g1_i1.p1 TRINITY_DN33574_c0_g1~~TRINITY_DN33574_c0_g1_i1.p1  ORF type:complete len:295 (-),score=37.38 TRINITY_DN33574_c0_g1_i1:169-1053(-)